MEKPQTSERVRDGGAVIALALAVVALINAAVPLFGIDVDMQALATFNAALVGMAAAAEVLITKWQRDHVFAPETVEYEKDLRERAVEEGPPEDGTEPEDYDLDAITEPWSDDYDCPEPSA